MRGGGLTLASLLHSYKGGMMYSDLAPVTNEYTELPRRRETERIGREGKGKEGDASKEI